MRHRRALLALAGAALLAPPPLWAKPAGLEEAHSALQKAQRDSTAHQAAAAAAKAKARADAARAALLAEQQIAAAAALRRLEQQTADAAGGLAALQAQSGSAAQALRNNEAALSRLLPVMERLSAQPAATLLAVPEAPPDAVRGILVMQGIAATIEQRAEAVRRQAGLVATLAAQGRAQGQVLAQAVAAQQRQEDRLTAQIAAARSTEMADAEAALGAASASIAADRKVRDLQDVFDKLKAVPPAPAPAAHVSVNLGQGGGLGGGQGGGLGGGQGGGLGSGLGGAPVAGIVIQKFGAGTVAGPAEGVSYRAAPGARVVTPCAGPVLFADDFQSYGKVVIMDCGGGYDFVLSGMQHLDVAPGQRLSHGQPVGEMLRYDPYEPTRQPVLYVELRHHGTPVDPASWLAAGGSG